MIVKKKDRLRHENSLECIAFEYPLNDKDINLAVIEINGRYPEKGRVSNEIVKELVLVLSGEGKITIDAKEFELSEGDCLLILPKQKYFFEGSLKLAVPCTPAWSHEQYKRFEND